MQVIEKMEERLPTTLEYMDHLKSLFFCTICGYGNQQFIDIKTKKITFNADSCDSLVRNTFQFSYLMNNLLLPFIMDTSHFIVEAMKEKTHKMLKLKPLGHINKAIDDCAKDYRDSDENLNSCLSYCSFLKINRNTPEIEGYPILFTNFIVQLDAFIAAKGEIKQKKPPATKPVPAKKTEKKPTTASKKKGTLRRLRILQELLQGDQPTNVKFRLLEEKKEEAAAKGKNPSNDFVDPFDPTVVSSNQMSSDIFAKEGIDPNFDDASMAQALFIQAILDGDKMDNLDSIIRKAYADSYEPELDNIDSDDILSRPTNVRVHLHLFTSCFGFNGINITREMRDVDWNMSLKTLILSLKGKSKQGPSNDHLDLNVMRIANTIDNASVMEFHQHVFLKFDGTHLDQPNNTISDLALYMVDKNNEEYVKTTTRTTNLIENIQGEKAAEVFKLLLKSQEEKFAEKCIRMMSRMNNRLKNADLVQLKEIEDKIANATVDQLIELQGDIYKIQEICVGEEIKKPKCIGFYNRVASVFDLDPLESDLMATADELVGVNLSHKTAERKETLELLKKDLESLDTLEEECGEPKKLETQDCKNKLLELSAVYDVDIGPEFFDKVDELISNYIEKAEKKAAPPALPAQGAAGIPAGVPAGAAGLPGVPAAVGDLPKPETNQAP